MVFSTNQAKHFFVVTEKYTATATVTKDKNFYVTYEGPGGKLRSDLIKIDNIHYVNYSNAASMERKLKAVQLTLDSAVNEGNPIIGQDYIVTINFRNYFGPDETHTYIKQGVARAFTATPGDLYKKLAISLARNFARDITKPLDIYVSSISEDNLVTPTTKEADIEEATSVILVEKEQPWTLGVEESTPVNFEISLSPVTFEGNERIWGKAEGIESGLVVKNGKKIADMEYFYAKERGDQYGNIGWPNVVKTTYAADPEIAYDVIDIHYSYVGPNESVQKSEKDLTIAGTAEALSAIKTKIESEGITVGPNA